MSADRFLLAPPSRRPTAGRRTTSTRLARLAAWLVAAVLASGCGGGSKQSDGFAVSTGDLRFTVGEHQPLPAAQVIQLTVTNPDAVYLGAAFVGTRPGWISVGPPSGSGSSWSIPVAVTSTSLPPGSYGAILTVGIANAGQDILATRDVRITYTVSARLSTSTPSLSFSAFEAGAAPGALAIGVLGTGIAWTASPDAAWIHLGTTSGTGAGSIAVTVDHAALAAGLHQGMVTIQAAGGGATVQVPVTIQVDPAAFTLSRISLPFSGVNGVPITPGTVDVALNGGGAAAWTVTASAGWIVLDKAAGSTPDRLTVSADPTRGPLASGSHAGTVTFTGTVNGRTITATVDVALTLTVPVLTLSPATLVLGGPSGRDLGSLPVSLSLSTGTQSFAWAASASQAWLLPSAVAGTVSATPVALTVAPDPAGLAGGTYSGSISFSATVNGDVVTASLPVSLALDDRRLLVSDTGVALARTPSLARTTRTLTVRDNFGAATAWLAAADQPWLTVTPSGSSPGDLVVSADTTGLAADALHEATVTVAAAVPDGRPPEVVKVGLWIGSANPAPATTLYYTGYSGLALDPVRPYAYVHKGGADLTVYNVYTAQVVGTIASVAAALGDMTVSLDGATLYATDRTNFRIVPVDLATRTVKAPWPVGAAVGPSLHYARPNGRGLVLAGNGCIYDAGTGVVAYPAGGCTSTGNVAVSSSLRGNVFSLGATARSLDATTAGGGAVLVGPPRFPNVTAWNSADYAFNEDGSRMYLAVGSPYDFYVVDSTGTSSPMAQVQVLPGKAYPNNVEVARDGRIFAGSSAYFTNAWIYAPDGTNLATFLVAYIGPLDRMMKVSGDGLRLVTIATTSGGSASGLTFNTVAP